MLPTPTLHSSSAGGSGGSSKTPTDDDESALLVDVDQQHKKGENKPATAAADRERAVVAAVVVDVCLAAASLAGAALLTWWAVAFHPSYARLWMVPVGLVLACTPVVVFAALHISPVAAAEDNNDPRVPPGKAPPLSAVVIHK